MNFDISKHTILLGLCGSRAYGTNTDLSDYDFKGIAIAPLDHYLGVGKNFEQYEGKLDKEFPNANIPENHESVIYDIRKFAHLASLANPNILELLYLDNPTESNYYSDLTWSAPLILIRQAFLSKKVRYTYAGYAHAQLKRIRTHRSWLLNPPKTHPTREQFGLPEQSLIPPEQLKTAMALVDKQIEHWCMHPEEEIPITVLTRARESITELVAYIVYASGKKLGFDDNFLEVLSREKSYKAGLNQYKSYLDWQKNRNHKRSKLELEHGYDVKHGMHLVRLLRTCKELLEDKQLLVYRPDREELLEIRNGSWSFEKLEKFALDTDLECEELYKTTKLPDKPDLELINKTVVDIITNFHGEIK